MADIENVVFENVELLFRNFSGKEGPFNNEGDRNFLVVIPDDKIAQQMIRDGWNVKYLDPRDEGDPPKPTIQVSLKYRNRAGQATRPPRIVIISSKARMNVEEDQVEMLDWANIANADLIIRPFSWEFNGKSGVKAYLQSLFVTLEEDYLERKYAIDEE